MPPSKRDDAAALVGALRRTCQGWAYDRSNGTMVWSTTGWAITFAASAPPTLIVTTPDGATIRIRQLPASRVYQVLAGLGAPVSCPDSSGFDTYVLLQATAMVAVPPGSTVEEAAAIVGSVHPVWVGGPPGVRIEPDSVTVEGLVLTAPSGEAA